MSAGAPERIKRDPVRRHTYDIDDARARPGRPFGNGSAEHGGSHSKALITALKNLHRRQKQQKYDGPGKVNNNVAAVYSAILSFVDYKTGQCFPCIAAIASRAGVSPNTVDRSIQALEFNGLLGHVRRSQKRDDIVEGEPGPQRETISSGYFIPDISKTAPKEVFPDWFKAVKANLERGGAAAVKQAHLLIRSFSQAVSPPRQNKASRDGALADITQIKSPVLQGLLKNIGHACGYFEGVGATP